MTITTFYFFLDMDSNGAIESRTYENMTRGEAFDMAFDYCERTGYIFDDEDNVMFR